jgi:hypothetical protein
MAPRSFCAPALTTWVDEWSCNATAATKGSGSGFPGPAGGGHQRVAGHRPYLGSGASQCVGERVVLGRSGGVSHRWLRVPWCRAPRRGSYGSGGGWP